jgi:hypothetical protein
MKHDSCLLSYELGEKVTAFNLVSELFQFMQELRSASRPIIALSDHPLKTLVDLVDSIE